MAVAVTLTPQAAADIAGIREYLLTRNPVAADSVRKAIDATLTLIGEFSGAGRNRPELEARSIPVSHYPYTVYYRIEADEVVIVYVRDDRRRPPSAGEV